MRTFDVGFSYDHLTLLQNEISGSATGLAKFLDPENRPTLVMLQQIQIMAPSGFEVVAAIATEVVKKDCNRCFGGDMSSSADVKAGTTVFGNNHLQLWLRDMNGKACLHLCNLFHKATLPLAKITNTAGLESLIRNRMTQRLEGVIINKQREVREQLELIATLLQEERLLSQQLRFAERSYQVR